MPVCKVKEKKFVIFDLAKARCCNVNTKKLWGSKHLIKFDWDNRICFLYSWKLKRFFKQILFVALFCNYVWKQVHQVSLPLSLINVEVIVILFSLRMIFRYGMFFYLPQDRRCLVTEFLLPLWSLAWWAGPSLKKISGEIFPSYHLP